MVWPIHLGIDSIPSCNEGKKGYVGNEYKKLCLNTSMMTILSKILMIISAKDLELQKTLSIHF